MLRSRFQKGKGKRKRTGNQTICHERMLTLPLGIDYQQITSPSPEPIPGLTTEQPPTDEQLPGAQDEGDEESTEGGE
jgi:hypothetical protein